MAGIAGDRASSDRPEESEISARQAAFICILSALYCAAMLTAALFAKGA